MCIRDSRYRATVRGYAGEGWGGPDTGFYTRVNTLQLANLTVSHPVAVLLEDKQGGGASHLAGNIGLGILNRFTLIFDCPHGKLYLERSASYNKPEDVYKRQRISPVSGLRMLCLVKIPSRRKAASFSARDML